MRESAEKKLESEENKLDSVKKELENSIRCGEELQNILFKLVRSFINDGADFQSAVEHFKLSPVLAEQLKNEFKDELHPPKRSKRKLSQATIPLPHRSLLKIQH
jgi:hypothetical protein